MTNSNFHVEDGPAATGSQLDKQLTNLRKLLEELVPSLQNRNKKQRSNWSILYPKYVHKVSDLKLLVNHYQRLKKKSQGTLTGNEDNMLVMTRKRFKSVGIPDVKWSHNFNVFWFCILFMMEAGWLYSFWASDGRDNNIDALHCI